MKSQLNPGSGFIASPLARWRHSHGMGSRRLLWTGLGDKIGALELKRFPMLHSMSAIWVPTRCQVKLV